jgi:DNA-binding transcriptional ArsR family regulator
MANKKTCCGTTEPHKHEIPSDEIVKKQAEYCKALSDPARVRIIYALADEELCVCEIMETLQMQQTTVSHHLKVLKYAQIITDRKSGKWVNYSLADKKVLDALKTLGA